MEARVAEIAAGDAAELVWLLEHPPLYTSGTCGKDADLLDPRFPLFTSGRGGQLTYHGPGQRVAYVMLDLKRRRPDVRAYVAGLEEWIIRTLAHFNVRGERREDRVGVWVKRPDKGAGREDKIAAIGVRLRRWVSFHGIAINVEPELSHFSAIVPCGVADPRYGVTSLVDLGHPVAHGRCRRRAAQAFEEVFGPTDALVAAKRPSDTFLFEPDRRLLSPRRRNRAIARFRCRPRLPPPPGKQTSCRANRSSADCSSARHKEGLRFLLAPAVLDDEIVCTDLSSETEGEAPVREEGIPLHDALDRIATTEGFSRLEHARGEGRRCHARQQPVSAIPAG